MSLPDVSVIIPSYNRGHCLTKAIQSALRQTIADFEIVIADDGSTDDTAAVILALNEPRVRYLCKTNGGCSSARNFGVANVNTTFVAFLDSDDEWHTEWLENALGCMAQDPGIGAVYGSLELIGADDQSIGILDLSLHGRHKEATVAYVLKQCAGLLGSNVVARRDLVNGIGGWDETFPTSGDLDFGLRLATATRVALVKRPMIRLIETGGSLSKKVNSGNRLRVLDKFERKNPDLASQYADIIRQSRARILCSYGEDLLWAGRMAEAEEQLNRSLRMAPGPRALWLLGKAKVMKLLRTGKPRPKGRDTLR